MKITTVILCDKGRVQPDTIYAIEQAIKDGVEVLVLPVDVSELDRFMVLRIDQAGLDALKPVVNIAPESDYQPTSESAAPDVEGEETPSLEAALEAASEIPASPIRPKAAAKKAARKKAAAK